MHISVIGCDLQCEFRIRKYSVRFMLCTTYSFLINSNVNITAAPIEQSFSETNIRTGAVGNRLTFNNIFYCNLNQNTGTIPQQLYWKCLLEPGILRRQHFKHRKLVPTICIIVSLRLIENITHPCLMCSWCHRFAALILFAIHHLKTTDIWSSANVMAVINSSLQQLLTTIFHRQWYIIQALVRWCWRMVDADLDWYWLRV